MALFGDEDGDVGPFVMAEVEGGDEWFPFSLDNLEMDRACNASLQDDSRPMDQVRMCFVRTYRQAGIRPFFERKCTSSARVFCVQSSKSKHEPTAHHQTRVASALWCVRYRQAGCPHAPSF